MEAVFWILVAVLFYAYMGYGLLLLPFGLFSRRRKKHSAEFLPPVTVIVPAYNEEGVIVQKIENCLSLAYPSGLISIIVITDGSTDNTPLLVEQFDGITHLFEPERKGKSAAINRAMQFVKTPVVVFTDANSLVHPDSIRKMVQHYRDEQIGGVAGEKRVLATDETAVSKGESIYWQYESLLKKANAAFYTVVGAAGELFSMRTALFQPIPETIILDDFVLSARICLQGYRVAYEAAAFATETASETIREERKRKVRISAGCFQALFFLKALLNPFRNARLAFQYISHRVLRWTVCPLFVPLMLIATVILVYQEASGIYLLFLWLQGVFYLLAFAGFLLSGRKNIPPFLLIPCYFVFMNLSLYNGFFRFVRGEQSVLWKKAARKRMA